LIGVLRDKRIQGTLQESRLSCAIKALAKIKDARALEPLVELLQNGPSSVREKCLQALDAMEVEVHLVRGQSSPKEGSLSSPIRTREELQLVLQELEGKLRSARTPSLPVVSLSVRELLGKPRICWHFATGYGLNLDVGTAEKFLAQELTPRGVTISGGDYMGDGAGNRHNFWDFTIS
jgi:hypothetical protein